MAKKDKVVVQRRRDGDWGVSVVFANGKILAATEGYKNKGYAVKLAEKLVAGPAAQEIVVLDEPVAKAKRVRKAG